MNLPTVCAGDWVGWQWPVTRSGGDGQVRQPVVTQEWKPGRDPTPGQASGQSTNHLGIDIMYKKLSTDPKGKVPHDASVNFIAPKCTHVLAAGPGQVWGVYPSAFYGIGVLVDHGQVGTAGGVCTFYQHLESTARPWQKGDRVEAGELLGLMGFAPGDPEGLRHLHFELRFPVVGVPQDDWRIDPVPYMKTWGTL